LTHTLSLFFCNSKLHYQMGDRLVGWEICKREGSARPPVQKPRCRAPAAMRGGELSVPFPAPSRMTVTLRAARGPNARRAAPTVHIGHRHARSVSQRTDRMACANFSIAVGRAA
ncbi:hypothetical protein NUV26_07835, partial [Burkholderia pseudomultivorans]|uniref:hypothetical protein n=1 Tax=Burkholderia pseudomultivorans TaxID=1207504 RepID=UPI002876AE55